MKHIKIRIINTLSYVLMIIVNMCANLLPIGIGTTADVSNKYLNLFTPAGYTFGIWIVIYLLMGIYVLYQWSFFSENKKRVDNDLEKTYLLFSLSCILNALWVFAWHYDQILLSVILIIFLLITLITIQSSLNKKYCDDYIRKTVLLGFDIYVGWIVAATIANISVFLVSVNWDRFNILDNVWMVIVLVVGTIIGILFSTIKRKHFTTLTIVWAYIGILVNIISLNEYNTLVVVTLCACIALLVVISIVSIINSCSCKKAPEPVNN